jgi:glycogen debranching enzyme
MLTRRSTSDYQLPEVFAGMRRSETPFPIAYPTAARPQAWAAGTPVLLLQSLLGCSPTAGGTRSRRGAAGAAVVGGTIRLSGIRAFGTLWDARLEDGTVRVDAA